MSVKIENDSIYFDIKARQFLAGTWNFKPNLGHEHIRISPATAERIVRKQQNVALINNFLNSGEIKRLEAEGQYSGESELFLGTTCQCLKDGVWYGFYTANEMFVPMNVRCGQIYDGDVYTDSEIIVITKAQFMALILYRIYESAIRIPLLDKPNEDYIEFRFYKNGYATDGTGVLYAGRTRLDDCTCERWDDQKVHLVPVIPSDGDDFVDSYTDDQMVSVEEFTAICEKHSKDTYEEKIRIEKALHEANHRDCDGYDENRDQMERGLIDIYGEPGGWQFNNED